MNRELAHALGALTVNMGGLTGISSLTSTLVLNVFSFLVFTILLLRSALRSIPEPRAWRAELRRPHAAFNHGIITALQRHRILLFSAMLAATAVAVDPVLMLAPMLVRHLGLSRVFVAYVVLALAAGAVLGSLWQPKTNTARTSQANSRQAAFCLLVLGVSVVVFAEGASIWTSLAAAFCTGTAVANTWICIHAGLAKHVKSAAQCVGVMMLWVVVWITIEPLTLLLVGWLAGHIGLMATAVAVTFPVITIGLMEILLPTHVKRQLAIWGELVAIRVARANVAGQALQAVTALQGNLKSWRGIRVVTGLAGFAGWLTGDQDRYSEEFRGEVCDLAAAGKGRCAQAAYILRLLLAAGWLRVETRSARWRRAS